MVSRVRAGVPFARTLVVALAAVLAGCAGSGNGVGSKSAAEILAASRTAAQSASSVHVVSRSSQDKGRLSVAYDLQLASGGARTHTTIFGRSDEVVRIGDTVYVKGGPVLYERLARKTGVHVPQGAWLKEPPSLRVPEQTDLSSELGLLLRAPTVSLTKGATTTINGQKAIELKETGKLYTGAIYIATTGKPYPILIVKHGRTTGQTTFNGWNDRVMLSSPANAVELSKLERGGAH